MTNQNFAPGRDLFLRDGDLSVRPLCDRPPDCIVLNRWLQNPLVLKYFGNRNQISSLDTLREKYFTKNSVEDGMFPCLIEFLARPVGFLQFCRLSPEELLKFGYPPDELIFRVDLFIGEAGLWGCGFGRRALAVVMRHLFELRAAQRIVIDPQVDNLPAIRSYTAAGFRKVKLLPRHEMCQGHPVDCVLMEATRE